jgi:hypothetical protein
MAKSKKSKKSSQSRDRVPPTKSAGQEALPEKTSKGSRAVTRSLGRSQSAMPSGSRPVNGISNSPLGTTRARVNVPTPGTDTQSVTQTRATKRSPLIKLIAMSKTTPKGPSITVVSEDSDESGQGWDGAEPCVSETLGAEFSQRPTRSQHADSFPDKLAGLWMKVLRNAKDGNAEAVRRFGKAWIGYLATIAKGRELTGVAVFEPFCIVSVQDNVAKGVLKVISRLEHGDVKTLTAAIEELTPTQSVADDRAALQALMFASVPRSQNLSPLPKNKSARGRATWNARGESPASRDREAPQRNFGELATGLGMMNMQEDEMSDPVDNVQRQHRIVKTRFQKSCDAVSGNWAQDRAREGRSGYAPPRSPAGKASVRFRSADSQGREQRRFEECYGSRPRRGDWPSASVFGEEDAYGFEERSGFRPACGEHSAGRRRDRRPPYRRQVRESRSGLGDMDSMAGRFTAANELFDAQKSKNLEVVQQARSQLRGQSFASYPEEDSDFDDHFPNEAWRDPDCYVDRVHSVQGTNVEFLACTGLRSLLQASTSVTSYALGQFPVMAGKPHGDTMRGDAITYGVLIDLMLSGADVTHLLEVCWRRLTALHFVKTHGPSSWAVATNMESKLVRTKRGESVDPSIMKAAAAEAAILRTAKLNWKK